MTKLDERRSEANETEPIEGRFIAAFGVALVAFDASEDLLNGFYEH